MSDLIEEINLNRKFVSTDTYRTTWKEILDNYRDGILTIEPDFQRTFRWNLKQQTDFIESVILGLPFPPIFLIQEKEDSANTVLDGVQRICTMLRFFSRENRREEISLNDSSERDLSYIDEDNEQEFSNDLPNENNLSIQTTLLKGDILNLLENHTADTLPEVTIRAIKQARLDVILLQPESDFQIRYRVFSRLNRAGSKLSDQEVRNCAARLGGSNFPNKLKDLAKDEKIIQVMNLPIQDRRKMQIEEYLLRMLALVNKKGKLESKDRIVSVLLDDYMLSGSKENNLGEAEIIKVKKVFDLLSRVCPDGSAFKGKKGFSSTRFDVIATGVYQNIDTLNEQTLKDKLIQLKQLEESDSPNQYKELIGAGSNTISKMEGRTEFGCQRFK
jgi:uncharacterized protein with ParB-like and HNH nuclease domain